MLVVPAGWLLATVRVPPRWLPAANPRAATHTFEPTTARPRGEAPTEARPMTRSEAGSIRATVPSNSSLTQIPPGPAATARGPSPTRMTSTTRPLAGLSRHTLRSSAQVTHTAWAVAVMPSGPAPTNTGLLTVPLRVDARHRAVPAVCDPHRPGAHGD